MNPSLRRRPRHRQVNDMTIDERLKAIADALETASKQMRLLADDVDRTAFMKAQVEAVAIQKAAGRYDFGKESFNERLALTHSLLVGMSRKTNPETSE